MGSIENLSVSLSPLALEKSGNVAEIHYTCKNCGIYTNSSSSASNALKTTGNVTNNPKQEQQGQLCGIFTLKKYRHSFKHSETKLKMS